MTVALPAFATQAGQDEFAASLRLIASPLKSTVGSVHGVRTKWRLA